METTTSPRQQAADIFHAVLRSIDPYGLVRDRVGQIVSIYTEGGYNRLFLISFGKAAFPMAKAFMDGAGRLVSQGILITKDGHVLSDGLPDSVRVHEAGHPVPDARGVQATEDVIGLLAEADAQTLVVCLISGGGSALLAAPSEGIHLPEKQEITRMLLNAGADIGELNTVRKHLSRVKGGRLAELAHPAKIVSLILSDVIGDPLDVIASGPTSPDRTTFGDALAVIDRYHLRDRIPAKGLDILLRGERGEIPDTPKAGSPVFDTVENLIIGNNQLAIEIAAAEAAKRGYRPEILSSSLEGEARDVARWLTGQAAERAGSGRICLISGGETTVSVTGGGLGGRNMEMALAFALEIKGTEGITLLSAGTDGTDGPTDAAGAIVDGDTLSRAEVLGLDARIYLHNNDSYHFLQATKDLFVTGPTGTNVMDLQIILLGRPFCVS